MCIGTEAIYDNFPKFPPILKLYPIFKGEEKEKVDDKGNDFFFLKIVGVFTEEFLYSKKERIALIENERVKADDQHH